MTEYISKKITAEGDKILKYVQAHYQLEKGEKATEIEVLEMALEHIAEEKYAYTKKAKRKYKFSSIIGLSKSKVRKGLGLKPGLIKGGPKSSSDEIDKVVYGV